MSSALTMVNWCAGDACDPCACHWIPSTFTIPSGYKIVNPGHADDGAINQARAFCGEPFWGMALASATPGAPPGSVVDGIIPVSLLGTYSGSAPTLPLPVPPLPVTYEGVTVFSIDPNGAPVIGSSFSTGGGHWSALVLVTFSGCIMLDFTKDQPASPASLTIGGVVYLRDCVLPYTGSIPDPVFSIVPVCSTDIVSGSSESVLPDTPDFPPPFFLRVNKLIDPI